MALISAFGSVVRNAKRSFVVGPSFTLRTGVQRVHRPAKKASGRLSSKANQHQRARAVGQDFVFREGRELDDPTALDTKPSPPVRRGHVAMLVTPGSLLR